MATHLLVGNPTAQSGKNEKRIQRALDCLTEAGLRAELLPTLPGGGTVAAVRAALDQGVYRVVIAMGGDGTFREVATGLLTCARREEVALAMLPTGTANDQGRSFGLSASPDALAGNVDVIAHGAETRLDAGLLRGASGEPDCFFDSAGWGLSARVLSQRNRDRRIVEGLGPVKEIYRDHAVYVGAFVKTFLESYVVNDKFDVAATLDGVPTELRGLSDLVVKNTRVYAGAWVLDRNARHDDGAFEVVPFRGKRDWVSKAIVDLEGNPITEDKLNPFGIEHSHPIRARRIELAFTVPEGGAPLAAQLDGEEWPVVNPVRIDVEARALRLVVPAPHADPR